MTMSTKNCEHCGQPLQIGKMRHRSDYPNQKSTDNTRFCGFCRLNYACCGQGLHGEVGSR